jgi:hypothetical protein
MGNFQRYLNRILNEKYLETQKLSDHVIEIFKNPTKDEVKDVCLLDPNYFSCRGVILNDTQDLFIWTSDIGKIYKGDIVEHEYVIRKNWKDRPFIPVMLDPDNKIVDFSSWYFKESSLKAEDKEVLDIISKNKHVKSLGYSVGTSR